MRCLGCSSVVWLTNSTTVGAFHAWLPGPSQRRRDDAQLAAEVAAVHEQSKARSPWRSCGPSGGSGHPRNGAAGVDVLPVSRSHHSLEDIYFELINQPGEAHRR